ncbi:MAG TPA: hypothetical protein VGB46_08605, partial [Flavisolibacter sp.]
NGISLYAPRLQASLPDVDFYLTARTRRREQRFHAIVPTRVEKAQRRKERIPYACGEALA